MKRWVICSALLLNACSGFETNPAHLSQATSSNTFSLSLHTTHISNGYAKPFNLAGISDQTVGMDNDVAYANLKAMNTGLRQYNFFWSALETSGVASSAAPLNCPGGHTLVPANGTELASMGYHRYRCVSDAMVAYMDNFITRDAANGIQSAVALWSAPATYRYPTCMGTYLDACVPRDDAMDDYEDYVNFMAARYNGGTHGKIYHFIVWNENASATWFNYGPVVPTKGVLSAAQVSMWLDKYVSLMSRTHTAIARHSSGVMMYASTDLLWSTPQVGPADPSHIGTKTLVDGIWHRLGTGIDWSLAVHPYGDPTIAPAAGTYGMANLQSMVIDYQTSLLAQLQVANPNDYPQAYVIASEQLPFDPNNPDLNFRAHTLCQAHRVALNIPNLIGMDHNHFYGADSYSIVPTTVLPNLSNLSSAVTGQAYQSMNPNVWGKTNSHYCCQSWNLGCASSGASTPPATTGLVIGIIDGLDASKTHVTGWACQNGSKTPLAVHLYVGGPAGSGTLINGYIANAASEAGVSAACGTSGSANLRFSLPLADAAAYAGKTIYIYGISPSGGANALLANSGTFVVPSLAAAPAPAPASPAANSGSGVITGIIDGIDPATHNIGGWACASGNTNSINIHLYVGGPAGSGTLINGYIANLASEAGVSSACGVTGAGHLRFMIPASALAGHSGQAIYIHGISPTGGANNLLANSGTFKAP